MPAEPTQDVTALLRAWTAGDQKALDRLLPVLYEELRRILVERPLPLDELAIISPGRNSDFVVVDDALNALAKRDARKANVVEMRFFGGLSVEETAAALNVSTQTVLRDWSLAKAWLRSEMTQAAYD
jgi:DNA-directed RNA polymerase specialized sigma24 family protein